MRTLKLREWIANKLVELARRIHNPNEAAMQFYMDVMLDAIVHGRSAIRVTHFTGELFNDEVKH